LPTVGIKSRSRKDHLGSIAVITDETGVVLERLSYDAWGKRRFANGTDDPTGSIASQTTRGFTGEEFLADVGLVHLNGRIYDPFVGRMMSADPFVPDPMNAQAWNRYSYVINNPLAFTDPNGYCFLGLCGVGNAISGAIRSIGSVFNTQFLLGVLKIGAVAVCYVTQGCAVFIPLIAAVTSAVITGVTTGRLDAALQAGAIAGAQALAFQGLAGATGVNPEFLSGGYFGRAIGSALIGCGAAAASGGRCGAGALSGGISSLAGPITNGQGFAASLIANSVVGGLASVAGGGKFADGAVTGAFQYAIGYAASQSTNSGAAAPGMALDVSGRYQPAIQIPSIGGPGASPGGPSSLDTLWLGITTALGIYGAGYDDPVIHRGRIQVQGNGIEESWSWSRTATQGPPTAEEGQTELANLRGSLSRAALAERAEAFVRASNWIDNAAAYGGVDAPFARSFYNYPRSGSARVDIEVIRGRAFIP
jgi:RHS repeat-associated protein